MLELKVYENDRKLFEVLGWIEEGASAPKGNTRVKLLKQLDSICVSHKEGHKRIIDEVFDSQKKIADGRTKNSKYINPIEIVLLYALKKQNGLVYLSTSQLAKLLEIFNENYHFLNDNLYELSNEFNIDINVVKSFCINSKAEVNRVIARALSSMKKDLTIDYIKGLIVVTKSGETRMALPQEIIDITRVKKEELSKLGCINMGALVFRSLNNKFRKNVKERLDIMGYDYIEYFYDGYLILSHNKTIAEEIKKNEKEIKALELNVLMANRMMQFAENRHNKAIEKEYERTKFGEPFFGNFESEQSYLRQWERLTKILMIK